MEGLDVQKVEEPLQTPFQSFTYEQELLTGRTTLELGKTCKFENGFEADVFTKVPRGKTIITSGALTGEKEEEKQQQQEEEKEVVEEEELAALTEERWTEYSAEVRNSFGEHFSISS
ncbi:hypothetical protein HZH66_008277 [Vespula vulgaris]|uniref:Uncharacterized protein n=1 Tax=Vespula vulgaris TaxID=7454 RepID=A0A834N5I5_VESVU|nr:hypothetical protein HZH66_008277 [Vespula vulgaris]